MAVSKDSLAITVLVCGRGSYYTEKELVKLSHSALLEIAYPY